MEAPSVEFILYSIAGSFIPTAFWMWFWIRRDRFCPEPRIYLWGAFLFGSFAALLTLPTQSFVSSLFGVGTIIALVLFVSIEEFMKYIFCWYHSIRNNPHYNERIDPIVYLSTTALGFAFLENILFFIHYLNNYEVGAASIEGGKRIIGATMLHMTASAIIGVCLALGFNRKALVSKLYLWLGIVGAIVVHVGFNIMIKELSEALVIAAFASVWILFLVVLIATELLRSPTCPVGPDWGKL